MTQIAIFGLGRMGMQIARRLHNEGHDVLAWNRGPEPREEYKAAGGKVFESIAEIIGAITAKQRIFWVMLPNDTVENFIFEQLLQYLKPGDVLIDGGNSLYKDTIARAEKLAAQGVYFFDCGTSGGVWGLERGFALMLGGPKEQWPIIEPIIKALSSGDNYGLVGTHGAGHFVKMVHNGIEYGMMEAIGEGYAVLNASQFNLDLKQVTQIYQKGSVITSWLIDLTRNIFEHEDIAATVGKIDSTGEGEWTINAAKELGVDVRVIEASYQVRQESVDPINQGKFSNKIVALLRKQFGGHKTH